MKTIEITLFSYSELSEKAKEKALTNYQNTNYFYFEDDALESLKAFFDEIGVKLKNYEIDYYYPRNSWVRYEGTPSGKFIKENLTGFWFDYPLTKTWNKTKNIDHCLYNFSREINACYEHQFSEQGFIEHCEVNEIYFDEKGNQF